MIPVSKAQKEKNLFEAEVHRSNNSIGRQTISLENSKVVLKTTTLATRNIQNGLNEVKGLYTSAEVNVWLLWIQKRKFHRAILKNSKFYEKNIFLA